MKPGLAIATLLFILALFGIAAVLSAATIEVATQEYVR